MAVNGPGPGPALAQTEPTRAHPLTLLQRDIWFDQLLHPPCPLYNIGGVAYIQGALDVPRLEQSLNLLAQKHDSLRTVLLAPADPGAAPLQTFVDTLRVPLPVHDVSLHADPEAAARACMQQRFEQPFVLYGQALFRYDLVRIRPDRHALLVQYHHLIADGWTIALLNRSLGEIYGALGRGDAVDLSAPSYADFMADDIAYAASPRFEQHRGHWLNKYAEPPKPLFEAMRDGPDTGHASGGTASGCVQLVLPQALYARLATLAQAQDSTTFQVLLGALYVLFVRLSGHGELSLGLPVLNRSNAAFKRTSGLFVGVSPTRLPFGTELSFSELLKAIAQVLRQDYRHQRFPLSDIGRALQTSRAGHSSLFDLSVSYERHDHDLRLGDAVVETAALLNGHQTLPLTLYVREFQQAADVRVDFVFNRRHFDAAEVEVLSQRLLRVLQQVLADPARPVGGLSLLGDAERHQLLHEWNATAADYPREQLVHELFEARAAQAPQAVAVAVAVALDGETLSYGALNAQANQLARHLRTLGVGPEARVALCVPRHPQMVVGMLAVLKAGGACVPLDPAHPAERLCGVLADSAPVVLLTDSRLDPVARDRLQAALARQAHPPTVVDLHTHGPLWAGQPLHNPQRLPGATPQQLACVIYTSGSTGEPKGVMVEHGGLCNVLTALQRRVGLGSADRFLQFASPAFDVCSEEVLGSLISGATLVLRSDAWLTGASGFWGLCERHGITVLDLPTRFWTQLVQDDHPIPACVRQLIIGGEALTRRALQAWFRRPGHRPRLINAYGPTEATINATVHEPVHDGDWRVIGRPIANTRIHLLDGQGQPVPAGAVGELHIAGDGVARGYLHRPDLTTATFVADPFHGGRLYRTGDMARYRTDGAIEFIGRRDTQVKLRGFRIELGEIEAKLLQQPGVREAAVLVREDVPDDTRLVAYGVSDQPLDIQALQAALAAVLPWYMVPAAYVRLQAWPLTPNGKLDRQALPAPDEGAFAVRDFEAPQGEVETTLARIWADVLQRDRVGRHDDFFQLGGHSLLAVHLMERLRQAGLSVEARTLFGSPTLAALAAKLGGAAPVAAVPAPAIPVGATTITPDMLGLVRLDQAEIDTIVATVRGGAANVQDIYPLAPLQEGILFHHRMNGRGDVYLTPTLFSLADRGRVDAFLHALQAVIARHDILRAAIVWEGLPEAVQVVWREAPMAVQELALDPADGDIAQQLQARFDPRHHRLDLRKAPLMHAAIAHDPAHGRCLLLLRFHHLVMDQTALEIMGRELRAHLQGQAEQLPAPLPFRHFVARARSGATAQAHQAFFTRLLEGVDEPTTPFGLCDVQGDGSDIAEAQLAVDEALGRRLRQRAQALGVGAATLWHLAFALVLARLSGRDDVVFGTVLSGRLQGGDGADRALGLFINTLPVRIRVGETLAQDGVRATHRLLTELLQHEHASLALAQRCSGVVAPAPLFSALLNYRHTPAAAAQHTGLPHGLGPGIVVLRSAERSNYPFSVDIDDAGDAGFSVTTQVPAASDPARVCGHLMRAAHRLVDALEQAPGTPLHRLDMLGDAERRLLREWNATTTEHPREQLVHELFEARAAQAPQAVALEQDGEPVTYAALNAQANGLAHHLRTLGVGPEARVALCVPRHPQMVVGMLAVLKAGGAYVPLDPLHPTDRLRDVLADSAPIVLLTDSRLDPAARDRLQAALAGQASAPTVIDLHTHGAQWAGQPVHNPGPLPGSTPQQLAYVIYTSGSTGEPKGVMVEHRQVCSQVTALARRYGLQAEDRVLQFAPVHFDASVEEIFGSLLCGAALVLRTPAWLADGATFWRLCGEHRITVVDLPTRFWQQVSADPLQPIPETVRTVIIGGEAVEAHAVAAWVARPGHRPRLFNTYGPTETTVVATVQACDGPDLGIGRPVENTRIHILDRHGAPVPIGVAGEIHIAGHGVARGYLNRPGLTAERFVDEPAIGEDGADGPVPAQPRARGRMYRTGDLGRHRADGQIEYLGRIDTQVKVRGFRVELGEIEARLRDQPEVGEAVVVVREDTREGGREDGREGRRGEPRLVAYWVPAQAGVPGQAIDMDAHIMRQRLGAVLPDYMLPAAYVALPALPLTSSGKLDRRALSAPAAGAFAARTHEAPSGEIETTLARLWTELLQVERVGREDHFFELGGHSLLAMRLVSRVQQVLHVQLGLNDLFSRPLLRELADTVRHAAHAALPTITLAPRDAPLPLSFAQQRLWFLAQMEGVGPAYHMASALRLTGPLDVPALQRALDRVIERHESLRTCFVLSQGQPVQRIAPPGTGFALQRHDLRGEPDAPARLDQLVAQEAQAPFDLATGPLIRGRLVRLGEHEHALLLTMHHLVSDGWSVGVLVNEMNALYAAHSQGREAPLAPLALQYADYAVWQRRWLGGDVLQAQARYWQQALAGAPALLALPLDRPRPARQDHAGASVPVLLDAALTAALKALGLRHGSTLFMTLLAGWAVVLSRLSQQTDLVIGAPVAHRHRVELEPLIGCFVNTLALRLDLSGGPTVTQLLAQVKARALAAQQHQDLPFEQVVECVKPSRSLAHSPLFQVALAWQNPAQAEMAWPGLTVQDLGEAAPGAKFDLTLDLAEVGDSIRGDLVYATALFDRDTAERHVGYLQQVLRAMVADAVQPVDRLPLLSAPERRRLLVEWNETAEVPGGEACIHTLFEAQARARPEAVALVHEGRMLSYAALDARASALARRLRQAGVVPDARVAVCLPRGPDLVVALLATLKAGGGYVPLDPSYPAERLRFMLQDSAPAVVLVQGEAHAQWTGGMDAPVIDLDRPGPDAPEDTDEHAGADGPHPGHLAYVIYTSGSTGVPKGVMVEHRHVTRLLAATWPWYGFGPDDVWSLFHSAAFDFSVWELWGALLHGGRCVVVPHAVSRSPDDFHRLVCDEGVTVLNQTPSAFRQFIGAQQRAPAAHRLRHVIFGGEALELATLKPWYAQPLNRHTRLVNMYGITETTVHVTWRPLAPQDADRPGPSPIGVRIPDLRLYILDAHRQPVPTGTVGELYVGGAGVARGYLNRPALTAERFLPDPFSAVPGARIYKTADLGRHLADGSIEYLGRNDQQVKVRGFRIEPGEIEARLLAQPGVKEAVVLVREDPAGGEPGDKRLVAYLVCCAAAPVPDATVLRQALSSVLPDHMLPSAYVTLPALPLTPNGKLDRQALPAPGAQAQAGRGYEAPVGDVEVLLARLWAELLGIERVGRHDNFFELGGHSLLVVSMVERLRQAGLQISVQALFSSATLAALAAAVGDDVAPVPVPPSGITPETRAITPPMLPLVALTESEIALIVQRTAGGAANVQDIYPLGPMQAGILYHHLLAPARDPYVVHMGFAVDQRRRLERLAQALQSVIDRHDILRTAVQWTGLPEPVQVVWRHAPMALELVTLDAAQGDAMDQLRARIGPGRWRFDLQRAPLVRAFAAQDPVGPRWLLLLVFHHLVIDHTTLDTLQQEVLAQLQGRQADLPPPLPFRHFVAQARLGVPVQAHEAFFKEMLAGVDEPTLPLGRGDAQAGHADVAEAQREVDATLARRARAQARRLGVGAASLWHLVFAQVLAQLSGREDVVFGTVLFGRMQGGEGADRALGLFINTLPLRLRIDGQGVQAAVHQTQALLGRLMRHEHAPLSLAQRCSGVAAPTPLFSALLNYRHGGAPAPAAARGWEGIELLGGEERSSYPLSVCVDDLGDGFGLDVQAAAATGLDAQWLCDRLHAALERLVVALAAAPHTALRELGDLGDLHDAPEAPAVLPS